MAQEIRACGVSIHSAIVRHTASGLACFGVPLCNDEWWPAHAGAHLQMLHRFFAVILGTYVIVVAATVRRRAPATRVARLGGLAIGLVLVQITLGVLSVYSMLALLPVTLHLGVAALLLVCNVALAYTLPARRLVAQASAAGQEGSARVGERARAFS